jgi:hypothetical protein
MESIGDARTPSRFALQSHSPSCRDCQFSAAVLAWNTGTLLKNRVMSGKETCTLMDHGLFSSSATHESVTRSSWEVSKASRMKFLMHMAFGRGIVRGDRKINIQDWRLHASILVP